MTQTGVSERRVGEMRVGVMREGEMSSGIARTQPMPGHSVGTLCYSLVSRPCPALGRLQNGMQKQLGGSGGCSPRKFWNF